MNNTDHEPEIALIRSRLSKLEAEKAELAARLAVLERARAVAMNPLSPAANIAIGPHGLTAASPAAAKIALFRCLFAGRTDVFPVRWENTRTQRSGYVPACANEWARGICGKPQVKCGACPNQAFCSGIRCGDRAPSRGPGGGTSGRDRRLGHGGLSTAAR